MTPEANVYREWQALSLDRRFGGLWLDKASFVPERKIQELRLLMRARKQLVREQTRHMQRIQKTLEEANGQPIVPAFGHCAPTARTVS